MNKLNISINQSIKKDMKIESNQLLIKALQKRN